MHPRLRTRPSTRPPQDARLESALAVALTESRPDGPLAPARSSPVTGVPPPRRLGYRIASGGHSATGADRARSAATCVSSTRPSAGRSDPASLAKPQPQHPYAGRHPRTGPHTVLRGSRWWSIPRCSGERLAPIRAAPARPPGARDARSSRARRQGTARRGVAPAVVFIRLSGYQRCHRPSYAGQMVALHHTTSATRHQRTTRRGATTCSARRARPTPSRRPTGAAEGFEPSCAPRIPASPASTPAGSPALRTAGAALCLARGSTRCAPRRMPRRPMGADLVPG